MISGEYLERARRAATALEAFNASAQQLKDALIKADGAVVFKPAACGPSELSFHISPLIVKCPHLPENTAVVISRSRASHQAHTLNITGLSPLRASLLEHVLHAEIDRIINKLFAL